MKNLYSKKKQDMSISELIELESSLASTIKEWVVKETNGGKVLLKDSKLAEIAIFNFKLIFADKPNSAKLRSFLFAHKPISQTMEDYTISRIQDLYIHICMIYPPWFIQYKADRLVEIIKQLKYDVDDTYVKAYPYTWLVVELQYSLRYLAKS